MSHQHETQTTTVDQQTSESTVPKPSIGHLSSGVLTSVQGVIPSISGTGLLRLNGAAIGLMLQLYEEDLGIPPEIAGVIVVSFYLTELVGAPIFGTMVDRRGWRFFLLLGPLLAFAAVLMTWATVFLHNYWILLVFVLFFTRLLEGTAVASNVPATLSFLSAASGENTTMRVRISGYFELASVGGTALGMFLGGIAYGQFGVGGFGVLALLYLISIIVFSRVPKQLPGVKPPGESHPNPWELLRRGNLWSFAPAWIAVNGILGLWLHNFGYQMKLQCAEGSPLPVCQTIDSQLLMGGYSPTTIGYIFTGFSLVFAVGMIIWMRILPHMRQSNAMFLALSGGLATCFLLFLLNQQHLDDVAAIVLLTVLLVAAMLLLSGFMVVALNVLMHLANQESANRGAMMGIYSVLLGIGQFLGGALGGFFAGHSGVNGLILLTLIFTLLALPFVGIYRSTESHA